MGFILGGSLGATRHLPDHILASIDPVPSDAHQAL
jgi:hypothetical protein